MRKLLSLFFCLLVSGVVSAQIAQWNATGLSGYGPSPWSATTVAANTTIGGLTRGAGVATSGGAAGNAWGGVNWTAASEAASISAGTYATFTIRANTGYQVSLSNLVLVYRRSGTGAQLGQLQYATDGVTFTDVPAAAGGAFAYTNSSTTTGVTLPTVTLSGITDLQNVPCNTTITFRIVNWGGTGPTGTWYTNGASGGLTVNGTVAAYSAPAISTDPATVTIPAASGTSFTVSGVTGAESYQWQRNTSGIVGGTWVDITSASLDPVGTYSGYGTTSTASSNTLTLAAVPASWNGYGYRCVVTNCSGSTNSGGALLNVSSGACSGTPSGGTAAPAVSSFCGSGSTTITLTGGSSGTGLTYQWSSSTTATPPGANIPGATASFYSATGLSATTYFWCTSTCAASGLSAISSTGTVTINPVPAIVATPSGGNVCSSGGGLSMTASGAATYSWAPATGLSATTGAVVTATPTSNTTYTITGTSAVGCTGTNTVNVTYSLNPGTLVVTPTASAACAGTAPQLLTATGGLVGPSTATTGSISLTVNPPNAVTTSILNLNGIPAGAVITGATVTVDFTSNFLSDYIINLKAPNGNILNLINSELPHGPGSFTSTVLSSSAIAPLSGDASPYTGTYAADGVNGIGPAAFLSNATAWSSLYSSLPNGAWTLVAYNATTFTNTTTINSWTITLNYSYQSPVTWAPISGLFTDAAGTIPYTGTVSNIVYVNPSTAGVTTYTATATNVTCSSQATAVVTVNPLPAAITGTPAVCTGQTTTLAETATGGTWSSSASGTASVDASGVVTGMLPGTANITYTLPTGCIQTITVTVNPLPANITGTMTLCESGGTTSLSETSTGGTWASGVTGVATVNTTGGVSGVAAGTAGITYTLPTGCLTSIVVTVNPLPAAITGTAAVCVGLTTTLSETATGGTWSSSASGTASVDASGIVTGNLSGTANVIYTLPTTCSVLVTVTVNTLPSGIGGTLTVCKGLTTSLTNTLTGGTWNSGDPTIATIDASGVATGVAQGTSVITYTLPTGCTNSAVLTVNPLPAAITGASVVCEGLTTVLNETSTGGTWSSSASGTATINSAGTVTGGTAGNVNITYAFPTGCISIRPLTVNPSPSAISGTPSVCQGLTITLSNTITGGTWASADAITASVSATGIVTGNAAGNTDVTYTLPAGCFVTLNVTVNPIPVAVTGSAGICQGTTAIYTDITPGGTWNSSMPTNASIDASGTLTGLTPGSTTITYTIGLGCIATIDVTVNPMASAITGTGLVCVGLTTTLSNAGGGTWATSNANASAGLTTGVVTGNGAGTSIVTYTLPTGCNTTTVVTVNPLPAPIGGSTGVCVGSTTTLTDVGGGTWTSSNLNATVGLTTGVVTGANSGVSVITYTLPTGCITVRLMNIAAPPATVSGSSTVCVNAMTTMTDATTGGTWTSGSPHAVVDAWGVVTGISEGPAAISYTLALGCSAVKNITVNPIPYAIAGTALACIGSTTTLLDIGGGTWSASNSNATVGLTTGVVTGITPGTVTITFTLPTTGCFTQRIVNVAPLPAPIAGAMAFCRGNNITVTNDSVGGAWTSANINVNVGTATGVVTGLTSGIATITYTLPTGCTATANVTVNAVPDFHSVTGSGFYCASAGGVHVGLDGSNAGAAYQLYNGSLAVGLPVSGSGSSLDFGLITAGTYTVHASYTTTGCAADMGSVAVVSSIPNVTPGVSIGSSVGNDSSCSGANVLFAATAVNGGISPVYQWRVNGGVMGASTASYSYVPANGDIISVKMLSNAACTLSDSAISSHSLTVMPNVTPAVTTMATPGNNVCAGTPVTFTANPANGGTAPVYRWKVNAAIVSGSSSYVYTPANGDVVGCVMLSNAKCRVIDSVPASNIAMSVVVPSTPAVSIEANPGNTVPAGTYVTFSAGVTGAAATVHYQWVVNHTAIAGATASTFSASNFTDGDSISCIVTNVDPCALSSSSFQIMHITTGIAHTSYSAAAVNIVPNPNNGSFTLNCHVGGLNGRDATVEVLDMLGQRVYSGAVSIIDGVIGQQILLDSKLSNGIYILNVHTADSNIPVRFSIQR
jgi:subtilisin-like proprotein convertase family protein